MNTRTDTTAILQASWAALDGAVANLAAAQWAQPSLCPGWSAHDVLVHVASIEDVLVGWPPGADLPWDRIAAVNAELAALPADDLLARYRDVVARRGDGLRAMTDEDFATPGVTPIGPGTYGRFMEIRIFDVWVHERDIRVPLGIVGDDGGPAAERAMDEVHNSLGYIVGKRIGLEEGRSIVFDITGPVTRRMGVRVDGRATVVDQLAHPDATVTADSLTFMLLACGRIDPEVPIGDGRISWTGDDAIGGRAARHLRFTI
jgi:uncharacterized protein (TIGR03083 family)